MRLIILVCALAIATSCSGSDDAPSPSTGANPGDLVLAATAMGDTVIARQAFVAGRGTVSIPRVDGDEIHFFVVPRDTIVTRTGAPIDDATLNAVEAGRPGQSSGCGRCLARTGKAPMIAYEGDVCPPPEYTFQPEATARQIAVASQVAFVWPGACACTAAPIRVHEQDWELFGDEPWLHDVAAATSSNGYALFSEHHSIAFDGTEEFSPSLMLTGRVESAVGLADGRYVMASIDEAGETDSTIRILDRRLANVSIVTDAPVRPYAMRRAPGGRFFTLGEAGQHPHAAICTAERMDVLCSALTSNSRTLADSLERRVVDAIVLNNGWTVLVFFKGVMVLGGLPPAGASTTTRQDGLFGSLDVPNGEPIPYRGTRFEIRTTDNKDGNIQEAHRLDDTRIVVCSQGAGARLARIDIGPTVGSTLTPSVDLHLEENANCGGFVDAFDLAGVRVGVRAHFTNGTSVLVLADDATPVVAPRHIPDGMAVAPVRHVTLSPGRTAAFLRDGDFFVRDPIADGYRQRYGVAGVRSPVVDLHDADGVLEVRYQDGQQERRATPPTSTALTGLPTGAVITKRDGNFIVGASAGAPPWIARALDGVEVTDMTPFSSNVVIRDLTAVNDDIAIAIDTAGTIWRWRDSRIEAATIDWDDPSTPDTEQPPTTMCEFERVENGDNLRAGSASLGTVWVVGCNGTMLRVQAFANPPTAHRIQQIVTEETFTTVDARCPDDVIVSARSESFDWGRSWRFFDCADNECLREIDLLQAPNLFPFKDLGLPTHVVGTSNAAVVAYASGLRALGGKSVFRIIDRPTAIVTVQDDVYVGTDAGRVYRSGAR